MTDEMKDAELYRKELPLYREKLVAVTSQRNSAFSLMNWGATLLHEVMTNPSLLKEEDWVDEVGYLNTRIEELLK